MPIAEVNGQRLYYEDTGGVGPAVIFSHGLFMDHEMFAPQVAALKDHYRCITWDERGHAGTASDTLAPFTYYDSANDLAALLAHLGIERAVLAGMSQGGFLSPRCALTHPEIVRALILIDTQAGQEDPERLKGHMQLANAWASNGLSDEMAAIIEGIILGQSWARGRRRRRPCRQPHPPRDGEPGDRAVSGGAIAASLRVDYGCAARLCSVRHHAILRDQSCAGTKANRQMQRVRCPEFQLEASHEFAGLGDIKIVYFNRACLGEAPAVEARQGEMRGFGGHLTHSDQPR
jgi:pimeloyl-ACP methyl ester carboxylesterase